MSLSSIIIDRIRIRYAAVLFEVANLADWLKVACSVPSASRMPRRGSDRLRHAHPCKHRIARRSERTVQENGRGKSTPTAHGKS